MIIFSTDRWMFVIYERQCAMKWFITGCKLISPIVFNDVLRLFFNKKRYIFNTTVSKI